MRLLRESAMALAIGAMALMATPAAADDRDWSFGRYPWTWQGSYAGVHVGVGDMDGAFGGAQIGYNWQKGRIVYGVEADFSLSSMEEDVRWMGVELASVSVDWFGTMRGRVGYLIDPSILVYGTAGFAVVHSDSNVIGFQQSGTNTDFVVGLGVEGKISQTMTGRLEFLTSDDLGDGIIRAGLNFKLGR
jgi:outer membrane immunogenic protein